MARSSSPRSGLLAVVGALRALDPHLGLFEVGLVEAHPDSLRDAQPVPVDHQDERVVTGAVPAALG